MDPIRLLLEQNYQPEHFGKEYCKLHTSSQYPMFVATSLGIKPVFDDWIPVSKFDEFVQICRQYDMVVEPDVVFRHSSKDKQNLVGGKNITTTYQDAHPFSKESKEGTVHVFVSRSKEKVLDAKKWGWYSVIINNRSTNKPFIDNLRFGFSLGFPDCCIDFFREYNNWHYYSHPFETYKNTLPETKSFGSYHCNNYMMDRTYFLIHHLPCSYQCKKTIALGKKIEEAIQKTEPKFIECAQRILKLPLLVFEEQNFIVCDGTLSREEEAESISYTNCHYFPNPSRKEATIDFFDSIKKGNKVVLEQNNLVIQQDEEVLKKIPKKENWFMIDFA